MTDKASQDRSAFILRENLRRAREGDREAAIDLIRSALPGLLQGRLDKELGLYLAISFEKALQDRDRPNFISAFNLSRPKGRPLSNETLSRDMDVAFWVHLAEKVSGLSLSDAKAEAGRVFGLENIDRSLRNAGIVGEINVEACTEHFHLMGKPLPSRP